MSAKVIPISKAKAKIWKRVSDNLVLHRPTGIFYARKSKAGKGRLFKTTGEKRKGRAQTIADQMIAEWMGGKLSLGRRYRIDELCDLLDVVLEEETKIFDENGNPLRRESTRSNDRVFLPIIKTHFGEVFADEIDELYWQDWVKTEGRKLGRRLGDIAKYLSKVLTFAFERKIINRKPKIENPDPEKDETPPTYELQDIQTMLTHAEPDLRDLIIIGAECGSRPHENRELRWDWVTIQKETVKVRFPVTFTKTKKSREILLSPGAAAVIRRRALLRGRSPFVFPSPKDPFKPLNRKHLCMMWGRMRKAAGLKEGIRFHWLRHTFFSQALLEAGKPLAKVAAYGGNSPKVLFDRYMAKDAERTKDVAGVVDLGTDGEE